VSHFFQNVYHKIRYSDPPRLLFDLLSKFKIFIFPFNLYCFEVEEEGEVYLPPKPEQLAGFRCEILGRDSIQALAAIPKKGNTLEEVTRRFDIGEVCYGMLTGDTIAGYCWFNLKECTSKLYNFSFEGRKAAYLYDLYVLPEYRGRGLSPFLVTEIYPWARDEEFEQVYATINLFNNPSNGLCLPYRQEVLVKMLYVSLFNIYEHTFLLKRYKT
jgi:GNAT superfamily N-acetyltransferase